MKKRRQNDLRKELTSKNARRLDAILAGPPGRTLLQLAVPNLVLVLAQGGAGFAESYFISRLGDDAFAGVSLVSPIYMMMFAIASGGFGGGVSAAIAHAIGNGHRQQASEIASHAIVLAALFGLTFTIGNALFGTFVLSILGGEGEALRIAQTYAAIVFTGALAMWLFNTLAAILRGTGSIAIPALTAAGSAATTLVLGPILIFGLAGLPKLGVAGAAVTAVTSQLVATLILLKVLTSGNAAVHLTWSKKMKWCHFASILGVAGPASLSVIVTNFSVVMFTGAFGILGVQGLAAYGAISRLEYLFMLLTFAIGMALIPMASANLGAGQFDRARRCAWIGGAICALLVGIPGIIIWLWPYLWLSMFTADPVVLQLGRDYLSVAGPGYLIFGLGLGLFFAAQGLDLAREALFSNVIRVAAAGMVLLALPVLGIVTGSALGLAAIVGFVFYGGGLLAIVAIHRPRPVNTETKS